MKYTLLTLLLSITAVGHSSGQKVDSLFYLFKKNKEFKQGLSKPKTELSDEMKILYYTILDKADFNSLEEFTNDNNPAIRSLMFIGLAHKNAPDSILHRIYLRHQNDSTNFESGSGCVRFTDHVNNFMKVGLKYARDNKIRIIDFPNEITRIKKKNIYPHSIILPGFQFNRMKKEELLRLKKLTCFDNNYKVNSFTIANGKKVCSNNSDFITNNMKEMIEQMQSDSRLFIEDIKIKFPDNGIRSINGITIIVE